VTATPNITLLNVCETARGGVGRYQVTLAALAGHGITPFTLLPDSDSDILDGQDRVTTFARRRRGLRALGNLARAFLRERKRLKPDIYFFHSTFSLVCLGLLRLMGDRTPALYCAHGWAISTVEAGSARARMIRWVEGWAAGLADRVVNVSHADAELARQNGYRGRHMVIENAVPPARDAARRDRFSRTTEDEVHLLFVGRFDRQKGLDILLPAFDQARSRAPLHLHLVGEAVRDGADLSFPDGVTRHGWASPDEVDDFYRSADALIVPSRWEGLPLVVPEALRNGTPVFVADRSGMADLVQPGATGGVFDLAVSDLADTLSALRRHELLAMRAAARASYEDRFALDRFAGEMAELIRSLLTGPENG
jgi:glycosyltransferase involved in cell wall biosynthesis